MPSSAKALEIATAFIKAHEGCRLTPYQDQAGKWTAGWGHVIASLHKDVAFTQAWADQTFSDDLAGIDRDLDKVLNGRNLSDEQRAALLSFAFNLGVPALASSHLLKMAIDGDFLGAARQFQSWDHLHQGASLVENKGLLIRRLEEAVLFLQGS